MMNLNGLLVMSFYLLLLVVGFRVWKNGYRDDHKVLALLILGELFISGVSLALKEHVGVITIILGSIFWFGYLWLFVIYPFLLYISPTSSRGEKENVLLILGASVIVLIFSDIMAFGLFESGGGYVIPLIFAYTGVYLSLSLMLKLETGLQQLLKIPYPLLAPLAMIEQFGIRWYLLPPIIIHYSLTALWIKSFIKTANNQEVNSR